MPREVFFFLVAFTSRVAGGHHNTVRRDPASERSQHTQLRRSDMEIRTICRDVEIICLAWPLKLWPVGDSGEKPHVENN